MESPNSSPNSSPNTLGNIYVWFFVRLLKMVIDKGGTGTVMLADHNSPVATLPDIHSRYIALYQWMGTSTTHVNAEVTVPFGFLKLSYRSIV